ncbi:hypothetical protein, partial [Campylobacter jejuni]
MNKFLVLLFLPLVAFANSSEAA